MLSIYCGNILRISCLFNLLFGKVLHIVNAFFSQISYSRLYLSWRARDIVSNYRMTNKQHRSQLFHQRKKIFWDKEPLRFDLFSVDNND